MFHFILCMCVCVCFHPVRDEHGPDLVGGDVVLQSSVLQTAMFRRKCNAVTSCSDTNAMQ